MDCRKKRPEDWEGIGGKNVKKKEGLTLLSLPPPDLLSLPPPDDRNRGILDLRIGNNRTNQEGKVT
jgi:hypothetical protein